MSLELAHFVSFTAIYSCLNSPTDSVSFCSYCCNHLPIVYLSTPPSTNSRNVMNLQKNRSLAFDDTVAYYYRTALSTTGQRRCTERLAIYRSTSEAAVLISTSAKFEIGRAKRMHSPVRTDTLRRHQKLHCSSTKNAQVLTDSLGLGPNPVTDHYL